MTSLSEDLAVCVLRTEDMISAWTEFAVKYSQANGNLVVPSDYRTRLLSAFEKFDGVSREVDKIVFCSVDENSNLASGDTESEGTPALPPQPAPPDLCEDNSSPLSTVIPQTNPPAEPVTPNVEIGDQPKSAADLSPVRCKNEARHFKNWKNLVMCYEEGRKMSDSRKKTGLAESVSENDASMDDHEPVVDLTLDPPTLLEMDTILSVSPESTKACISPTIRKNTEQANTFTDLSASVFTTLSSDRSTDIMPLAEQLYLSDISDEDNSSQLENTSTEEEPAASDSGRSSNVENDNGKASFPSSQSNHLFSSCSQTVVKSLFDVLPSNSRVSLSVPSKLTTNRKSKSSLFGKSFDRNKVSPTSQKNVKKKSPSFTCRMCERPFPSEKSLKRHLADMHADIYLTYCKGCGLKMRRFEANSHYNQCLVYKHKDPVDRKNGMLLILNKSESVLSLKYNRNYLKKQKKLLAERDEIDIPADPPSLRTPKRIDRYFESVNWPCDGQQNSN